MAEIGRPGCPGCGGQPATAQRLLFCAVCWTDVPTGVRKRLEDARKAMGRSTSTKVVAAFEAALNEAVGCVG